MKKTILILCLIVSQVFFAQTTDLVKLAKGNYLGFNAVFDNNDNLFGYVTTYGYGKVSEKTKKFEYVILDKNLNPLLNKEFEGDITAIDYTAYMDNKNDIILYPSRFDEESVKKKDWFYPSSHVINLKTNIISRKNFYDYDGLNFIEKTQYNSVKENKNENKKERNEKGFVLSSKVYELKSGDFFVETHETLTNMGFEYYNSPELIFFDNQKKEKWRYSLAKAQSAKKILIEMKLFHKDEKHLFYIKQFYSSKEKYLSYMVFEIETGKLLKEKKIEEVVIEYNSLKTFLSSINDVNNRKKFDDKFVSLYQNFGINGFSRFTISKQTLDYDYKFLSWIDFKPFLPKIDKYGEVEKGYSLRLKDLFFHPNGEIGFLFEKIKSVNTIKTLDMVLAYTDKDFKLKEVKTLEKEKSIKEYTDFLFSQYLNKGNDVVFFFKDYQKDEVTQDKNLLLFINTYINGKFNQDQIKISSKENIIFPYIAKEGYILLNEYNEKEKYNQLRLERLNY